MWSHKIYMRILHICYGISFADHFVIISHMYLKWITLQLIPFKLPDLAGTTMKSPRSLLAVAPGSMLDKMRRKSDSRLNSNQFAHLQQIARLANKAKDTVNVMDDGNDGSLMIADHLHNVTMQNVHDRTEQVENLRSSQQNANHQIFGPNPRNLVSPYRGDAATGHNYAPPLNLGPFQVIPPQIHHYQHSSDSKFIIFFEF